MASFAPQHIAAVIGSEASPPTGDAGADSATLEQTVDNLYEAVFGNPKYPDEGKGLEARTRILEETWQDRGEGLKERVADLEQGILTKIFRRLNWISAGVGGGVIYAVIELITAIVGRLSTWAQSEAGCCIQI